jgi:hypothetical protein
MKNKKQLDIVVPKYDYTGWEISPECLIFVQEYISSKKIKKLDIVEFGSGASTGVLLEFKETNEIPGVFDSFDCDVKYAHPYSNIRQIIPYDDRPVSFGNDYSFYKLHDGDLRSENYNLVILDGHHGHGRSVAWQHLKDKLANGCVVVIDDYDHYPFVEDFLREFPNAKELKRHWEDRNRWIVYEIVSK